jgi:[ribosomal protein S5]-alanine N-acetyltransferase
MFAYGDGCGKLKARKGWDKNMGELSTVRLVLRPIARDDADALHELWTNKEVRRYLWENRVLPLEAVHGIIASSVEFHGTHGSGFYSVRTAMEPGKIVGFCGHRAFEAGTETELLYGMHPDYWSKGLGTEAARRVLAHGFTQCDFERIIASTDTPNQRSVKVLQRLGMSFDRRQQRHGLDTVFYSMTKREFLAPHK